MDSTNKTLFKEESFKNWGLYESRSFIGAGFLEAVYEEALEKRIPHSEHSL
jgi:hypothetical protein